MKYLFFILLVFGLGGCANHVPNTLKNSFSNGKSIVIVPKPITRDKRIYWSRMEDDTLKDYFSGGYNVGYDYMAIPMDAGIYYIRELRFITQNAKTITDNNMYISDLGYVTIVKTTARNTNSYLFDNDNMIGFFTVEPDEVVLLPSVLIDADIAENSCRLVNAVNNEKESFLFQMLISNQKTLLGRILDALDTSDGNEIQEWRCPMKAFFVTIETKSVSDFLTHVNEKSFPDEMLDNIQFRGFEFGSMLEKAQKMEIFIPNIEQYEIRDLNDF
ncbi:MAG: hypothetical protein LBL65_04860 [Campylobacteraceae bacterium]|jgi:hypothetical protein|nr:hypothetical protein [Campylobacteraceae bacterium]